MSVLSRRLKQYKIKPTQYVIIFFMAAVFVGTILLSLPVSSKSGQSIGLIDSLFTAASAVCVTGLVLVDTQTHWTVFGQLVILALIQAGGLGIMTSATLFSIALRRTISLKERLIMAESINQYSIQGIVFIIKRILIGTFLIEAAGAILLSFRFIPEFGIADGLFKSIFHSVSAFCNAGFDLMGGSVPFSSFTKYTNDILVNFTLIGLIIAGGTGYAVWSDLISKKKFNRLFLHTKIVLSVSVFLITLGFVTFFIFEYNNPATIGDMSLWEKIISSFFQSITTRTAGFNTIDQGSMSGASKLVTMLLMFIGGSPGSTAGGIKTVTAGVLIYTALSVVRQKADTEMFGKRVNNTIVRKAFSIAFAGIMLIAFLSIVLMAAEKGVPFDDVLFEAFSAFGTVGLSTGITAGLSTISKIAVVLTMFCGRVGILTMGIALASSISDKNIKYRYTEETVSVG